MHMNVKVNFISIQQEKIINDRFEKLSFTDISENLHRNAKDLE